MLIKKNGLFDEGFVCNGTNGICLDNLNHIYVQKYVKEVEKIVSLVTF